MEVSFCSQDMQVSLCFVRPAEGASSPCLLAAYQESERFKPKWISAAECLQLKPSKSDVFVCDPFEGKAFTHLTSSCFKCAVVGPRCVLSCLYRVEPIPKLPGPIHNTAMRGLIITTTGFEKERKEEIKCLVERMAGIYSSAYHGGITHLVANEVGSKKYQVAVKQEIPIMTGEWVKAVLNAVTRDPIHSHIPATDGRFLCHACPVFYGMVVCVSQLDEATKQNLQGIIEENGGTYSPQLEMSKTSVLILSAPKGEKYTYAGLWRIKCLTPDWIYDSVEQGHALPMESYEVKKQTHSTPKASNKNSSGTSRRPDSVLPPEVSQCSTIPSDSTHPKATTLEETEELKEGGKSNAGLKALDLLDLQEAQRVGLFLDGCKIFLSGFSNAQLEKLRRILNCGGATRFNQLTEAVSHVVIGKPVSDHLKLVRGWSTRPNLVYAHWITESIQLRRPAEEGPFAHPLEEEEEEEEKVRPFQRPTTNTITKNNTTTTTTTSKNTSHEGYLSDEAPEEDVLVQYIKPSHALAANAATSASASAGRARTKSDKHLASRTFYGKTFTVSGQSEDSLARVVEKEGGRVVSLDHQGSEEEVHYSLVSTGGQVHLQAKEVVSSLFLYDCMNAKRLVPVMYYHIPLFWLRNTKPLEDCCVTISSYSKNEKVFLQRLITFLGGRNQDMFASKNIPEKTIFLSTHLVLPKPDGDKYRASRNWGVPAVTGDWLLDCFREGRKVDDKPYSVLSPSSLLPIDRKKLLTDVSVTALKNDRKARIEASLSRNSSNMNNNNNELQLCSTVAEVHTAPRTLRSMKDKDDEAAQDGSLQLSPSRKKMRSLGDTFSSPSPSNEGISTKTTTELFHKFCEDYQNKMNKQNRKPRLQLQENGTTKERTKGKSDKSIEDERKQRGKDGQQEEDIEEQQGEDEQISRPLKGLVICPSRELLEQGEEISAVVQQLGGQYQSSYGAEVTHFLYHGRPKHREFRRAKEDGKSIVAPDWLWMCQEKRTRVEECLFPHNHNPNMSLSLEGGTPTTTSRMKMRKARRKKHEDGQEKEEEDMELEHSPHSLQRRPATSNGRESKDSDSLQEDKEALSKQLEEIRALAQLNGKKSIGVKGRSKPLGEWHRQPSSKRIDIETQPMLGEVTIESQGTAITWEDPSDLEARQHLKNQFSGDTQNTAEMLDMENGQAWDEEQKENGVKQGKVKGAPVKEVVAAVEDDKNTKESMQKETTDQQGKPQEQEDMEVTHPYSPIQDFKNRTLLFALVGVGEGKNHYSRLAEELGASVTHSSSFDPDITHLIAKTLSRSERTLAAIASGKWVVHTSYLEHSHQAGHFLKEEPYAWGNPTAKHLPSSSSNSSSSSDPNGTQLAKAAWRWRGIITGARAGRGERVEARLPFQHVVALFHTNKDRTGAFTRMIKAGGGKVVTAKPPYEDLEGITHFFVEREKASEPVDLRRFAERGIPCMQPIYISNYLTMDPVPQEEENYDSQYRDLIKSMSGRK